MMTKKQWKLALFTVLILTGTMTNVKGEDIVIENNNVIQGHVDVNENETFQAFHQSGVSKNIVNNSLTISNSTYTDLMMSYQDVGSVVYNTSNQMKIDNSTISGNLTGMVVRATVPNTSNLSMQIMNTTITGDVIGVSTQSYGGGFQLSGIQMILDGATRVGSEENSSEIILGRMDTNGNLISFTLKDSSLTLKGKTDVSHADIWAYKFSNGAPYEFFHSNNRLILDGWSGSVKSLHNFDAIQFQNLKWNNDGVVLDITEATGGELTNTSVQVDNLVLKSGTSIQVGDKMTFIQSNEDTGLSEDNVSVEGNTSFSQGVATVGELEMKLEGKTNNLVGEIKGMARNPQTDSIAENRTAAAAFLNQGADIAADSLDLLGSDYKYGLRTFGAVYGNRSTYDAAGDMKLNGWSEIVGLGNVHRKGDGDLSWGVFYENGTGNYRTWNEFNDEMFRGDGNLLYNGGGAALRYKRDDGWYYEASVRAGTLSASMENAVKDGNGNSYGFDSDSTYWGVHAGVGKLIETGRGEWNVYGKYFHTDIDGDSFTIDGDCFEFDSLTSDRLRLGARYTADKAKQWSMYYGLAWEYEFSGDSHMKAGQWDAPEQSFGGSTGILEIGTVWQPDDSPWQANINLKGYAGEREGMSGMVQLAYTF